MRNDINIRIAHAGDADVARLAALDSSATPAGAALVAEIDGHAVAAIAYDGSSFVADPFDRTQHIVAVLQERSAELRGLRVGNRLRQWRRGERSEPRRRHVPLARGARMALPGPTIQHSALQGR